MIGLDITHRFIDVGQIRLHVVAAGPQDGPPVILLHGFPEFWYGWRKQIPVLAAAGFRVIAPDQRGYNLSDKPPGIVDYRIEKLVADVVGVIDALGYQRVDLVGHDWGGGIAWCVAASHSHRLKHLAVLNCPHFAVFSEHLRRSVWQMLRSWYILYFQLPLLPEWSARVFQWWPLVRALRQMSTPQAFTEDDWPKYREAWSQPRAFTAMVNWYRALTRPSSSKLPRGRIVVPTLLIWGVRETALGRELAPDSIAMCDNGRLEWREAAGHFVQHDDPDAVNRLLMQFLSED
jgi:pimeloyl-ACP methyl ester carboxylesterase